MRQKQNSKRQTKVKQMKRLRLGAVLHFINEVNP